MKYKIILNSIFTVAIFIKANAVTAQNIDRIVAIIGDKIILYSDIDNQIRQAKQEGTNLGANPTCTVLEETMFQKLLVHQADVDSLEISEEQIEAELESRIRYFISQIGSKEKFEEYYGKSTEKFKDDFRDAIRDRMKAQQMQGKITGDVKITPKEVKDFFNAIPKDSIPFMGSRMEMAQIVKMPKVSVEEKIRIKEELTKYRLQIMSGEESFCSLALFKSEDPGTRSNCGEFELIPRGTFVPEFDAIAFTLKEGEISEVFETTYGYHILQLIERRGDMYSGRHILMIPKVSNLQMATASQELDAIYRDIKDGKITFEEAVGKYSDDEETKFNGGKLFNQQTGDSKFDNNDIDKALFISVDGMEPGEISEPVFMTTPDQKQGIRIIKLISRSEPHVANLHDDYPQISEAAMGDKKSKAILKWVKSKTKSMYVWVDEESRDCPFEYPWIKEQ
jgi:peptidyl-prolyl cis-trans isomerase SurA